MPNFFQFFLLDVLLLINITIKNYYTNEKIQNPNKSDAGSNLIIFVLFSIKFFLMSYLIVIQCSIKYFYNMTNQCDHN
jgi:hypothetical protein